MRFIVAVCLLAFSLPALADEPKPPVLTPEERKLADEALDISDEGVQLYQKGKFAEAVAKMQQALAIRRRLYPDDKYPGGHRDLAVSLDNLGTLLRAAGQPEKAESYYEQALVMRRRLFPADKYPAGHRELANSLNNLGDVQRSMGRPDRAVPYLEQALAMYRALFPLEKFPAGHPDIAISLANLGGVFWAMGKADRAVDYLEQSLEMKRRLYPPEKHPSGHPDVALGLSNLGSVLQAMDRPDRAVPYLEQALAIYRTLFPAGHPDTAFTLSNLGGILDRMGQSERAVAYLQQALAMRRQLFPPEKFPNGHPDIANSLNNLGSALESMGRAEEAAAHHEQALEMYRRLYPPNKFQAGHPNLAACLSNLASASNAMGRYERGVAHQEQALAMRRRLYPEDRYPNGHPDLIVSLINLGTTLDAMGQFDRALSHHEQALAMARRLYPERRYPAGHPDIATCLNNIGAVFHDTRRPEQARKYYEQAVAMRRRLYPEDTYPNGHPELAESLNGLAASTHDIDGSQKSLPLYEQVLAMRRRLFPESKYPTGHPDLAISLNNLASVLKAVGQEERATLSYEQALAMHERLHPKTVYPAGHPALALVSSNLACMFSFSGQADRARPHFERSLAMEAAFTRETLLSGAEDEALQLLASRPLTRDAYLSTMASIPGSDEAAYRAVWNTKGALARVLELRHTASHAAAKGKGTDEALTRWRQARRRLDITLRNERLKPEDRDRELARLADERDRIERELGQALPLLSEWNRRDQLTPADLTKVLPKGSTFIDFLLYTRFEWDPKQKGEARERQKLCYAAFVMTSGRPVVRVELGSASIINAATREWRQAIESRANGDVAAGRLRELVWRPLADKLPANTKTLYLSPEGDLARLPWAALPIDGASRLLVEDFAVATVPHGTFLLEQLNSSRSDTDPSSLVTLSGVDYGSGIWPALPGTAMEVQSIAPLAPGPHVGIGGREATAARLTELLPRARWAHLATHGELKAEELAAERVRETQARRNWQEGTGAARRVAAKNPLGYVGLVLTGGEVWSGLSILDLDLSKTRLVTLSACETGLGEFTAAKGVENLQMAFHLAGAENVVASLWKVNDAATAALMTKFYHELWVNKKPPIDALREAQLLIYRRPDLIPDLAGERGAPKLKDAVEAKAPAAPGSPDAKRSPTKLWAAFVLSGVGK